MTKTVVIASNNKHKVSEIANALSFSGWDFKTLRELGIESDPVEDADDFAENARIKAMAAHEASGGMAALADDSGLIVDALGGAPGVFSARYASLDGFDCDDEANNDKLLRELKDTPDEERTARYACALSFVDEEGRETTAWGTVEGRIGHERRGTGGFGYDPLFWPDVFEGRCTMAEITQGEKEKVSHRGCALRELAAKLGNVDE
jgi:XTP/dITP diphosphohydrolase